jgi:PAS domain S-box-containing protein
MFILAAVVLTALSVLSYLRVNTLIESSAQVKHTQLIQLNLQEIESSIAEAELNQKNFLISGDSSLLVARDASMAESRAFLATLATFVRDNPKQVKNLETLQLMIDTRMSNMKAGQSLYQQGPKTEEFALKFREALQLQANIMKTISLMKGEEEELLRLRSSTLDRAAIITPRLTVFLSVIAVIILTASYFSIIRELKNADHLRMAVEASKQELVLSNAGLQKKTSQLAEGQELAHIGSWEWDVAANKIEWSDELYRIYGLTPQEFKADYDGFLKYTHPDDRATVNDIIQRSFQTHEPFSFLQRIITADGQVKILSATGKVFTDSRGNTRRMAGTAQDVTLLKETEERFEKIFNHNPVPMTLAEIKTNKIGYANRAFYSLFGYNASEVIGHTTEELNLISPEENQRLIGIMLATLQEGRSVEELQALPAEEIEEVLNKLKQSDLMKSLEITYTRKNGETFPAVVSFEIVGLGNQRYTIGSYHDVSARRKAQEQLTLQNQSLVRANKELESFNFISSHDLQEPLRQVQNFSSRLITNERANLTEKGQELLTKMNGAATRMRTLITDLLTYSRTTSTERKFEMASLDELVKEVTEELKEFIDEKHAKIEVAGADDIRVIRFQFLQLLHNLIGNALKFARTDVPPHITIQNTRVHHPVVDGHSLGEKEYSHFTVSDNGIGFEPQYRERIFEVFQRLHDKEKFAGTGIGLSIVKKIVENHGGVITATGEPNKGARFDIYIPVA